MKTCTQCKKKKSLDQFNKWHGKDSTRDGLWPWCKSCRSERGKEYRNRPEVQERRQSWGRAALLRRYGLTIEQFEAMMLKQKGKCAVCRCPPSASRRLDVDHDHSCCPGDVTCGKCIRGLVCARCNILLGYAKDDPAVLRRAARYLEAANESNANRRREG